jgi:hypothetical protein
MMTSLSSPWLEPHSALAHCRQWMYAEGRGSVAAGIIHDILVSLATADEVDLSRLRDLDDEQRSWLASILIGLPSIKDHELVEGILAKAA